MLSVLRAVVSACDAMLLSTYSVVWSLDSEAMDVDMTMEATAIRGCDIGHELE